MAATQKGVWDIQEVRDKQLASEWPYLGGPSERTALYTWGSNDQGKLGLNTQGDNRSSPVQVPGIWTSVAIGYQQSYGVTSDGKFFAWGQGSDFGELGQNQRSPAGTRSSPTQVGTETTWKTAVASRGSVLAVKTDGTAWTWGDNEQGMLAHNEGGTGQDSRSSPTQIGTNTSWSSDVKHLSGGYRAYRAIKTNGTLWTWGFHGYGQLGLNISGPSPTDGTRSSPCQVGTDTNWNCIDGSVNMTFATKTDGTLWAFGYNNTGSLGLNNGPALSRSSPVQVGTDTDWSIARTGRYSGYGLKTDGSLYSWGMNEYGQLGQGDRTDISSPTQIPGTWFWMESGYKNIFAQKTDGTLWGWGVNQQGQLGQNSVQSPADHGLSSPVQIPGYWNIKAVALSGGMDPYVGAGMKMP